MAKRRRATVTNRRMAGPDHQVVTVTTKGDGPRAYRREPCEQCPWRVDQTGSFPAEAFRHSAPTCYDAAFTTFACHMSGTTAPATCAGFLLRHAVHNVRIRISVAEGRIDLDQVTDGGHELHGTYREMAIANGVAPDDPVLALCRGNDE